jgi:hypothetical protein
MRIFEDRYDRDRQKFDLALRMLGLGAALSTITECTGLTADRIRTLREAHAPRRSGRRTRAPRDPLCLLRSARLAFEASTLGSLFCILGVLKSEFNAEMMCIAYEAYVQVSRPPRLSIDHAHILLVSLIRNKDLKLNVCGQCRRSYISHTSRIHLANCGCSLRSLGIPRRRRRATRNHEKLLPSVGK